ncbi:peptidyl-prolyl cis-trans isomerase [Microbaculum sp. FT89]|uniref:peptidylprolyl isomerase n=1 Tax=Microbaculum sp. FT89 TaxID=3447298 RepID=UPI003F536110
MTVISRLVREPLFQFLVIGAIVFAAYAAVGTRNDVAGQETIVVTPGRIAQLSETYSRTWQRPPTQDELNGLIDAFVKEEVFYREGRRLGLDTDDTVFRRRLQQKLEFMMEPDPADLAASDEELEAYRAANAEAYRVPERIAFRQIFFNRDAHGNRIDAKVDAALDALGGNGAGIETRSLGDRTMLPFSMPLTPTDRIAISFGQQFADALKAITPGQWHGPVESTFGLHLVLIDDLSRARDPDLADVRDAVRRDWEGEKRREIAEARYRAMRDKYDVTVIWPEAPDGQVGAQAENR